MLNHYLQHPATPACDCRAGTFRVFLNGMSKGNKYILRISAQAKNVYSSGKSHQCVQVRGVGVAIYFIVHQREQVIIWHILIVNC